MATTQSFTTRDGIKIVYDIHGDPKADKRVVLIHSLAMDRHYWRFVAQRLEQAGVCAVALDCRGHGESDKPAGPYDLATFGDDVRALLDALGWRTAVVAGSSMGGSVTLAFGIGNPDRLAGLGLIDTTAWYGKDAPTAWAGRAKAAQDKGLNSLIDFQLTRWFGEDFKTQHPEVVEASVATFLANDVAAYAATCNMLGNFDVREGVSRLKVPTQIVVGDEDYATPPAMAEEMQALMPHSGYTILPKARHLTPLERPDEVTKAILAVVEEVR